MLWLQGENPYADLRKLNALYYKALRVATQDFKKKINKGKLDELGRARPSVWAKYITASTVMKMLIISDGQGSMAAC